MLGRGAWIVLLGVLTMSCGGDSSSSSSSPGDSSGSNGTGTTITGKERLGWEQAAADRSELSTFRWVLYVDGVRSDLAGVTCDPDPLPDGFHCSAPVPRLTAGTHTLEMATLVDVNGEVAESARSAPVRVVVPSSLATTAPSSASVRNGRISTSDGAVLRFDLIRADLAEPSDLAFTPDGRLLIAESRGVVRIAANPGTEPVTQTVIGGKVLAIAVDPAFADTRNVFVLLAASGANAAEDNSAAAVARFPATAVPRTTFMLVRLREGQGRLSEPVVLIDRVPAASEPHASVRFGPDRKLYVAFDDAGRADLASDFASDNGKVLRLEKDATTPSDQEGLRPLFAAPLHAPSAMAFQPSTGELWIPDQTAAGEPVLVAIGRTAPRVRGVVRASFRLPPPTTGTAALFYSGDAIAQFNGNLLVASADGQDLLRVVFDRREPTRVVSTERLLRNTIGPLRAITASPDGAIYLATDVALWRLSAG